jgi:hypothetical protein
MPIAYLVDLSDSEVRIDLWKTLKDQRSAIKICDINEHEQARSRDCGPGKPRDKCSGETHIG